MGEVLRTSQAHLDLVQIALYLGRRNPAAADGVLDAIDEHCRRLSDWPDLGRKRDELAPGLRSFPVGNFIVFYRPVQEGIQIIRILHGSRDLPAFFD